MLKGQAVVEWMVILSVAMMILAIMLTLNDDSFNFFQNTVKTSKVKGSLNEMKNAVDFVYSQGEDGLTTVYVTVPAATNYSVRTLSSGVGEISAKVYVKGNAMDFEVYTNANLSGNIPQSQGTYKMEVAYVDGIVEITQATK